MQLRRTGATFTCGDLHPPTATLPASVRCRPQRSNAQRGKSAIDRQHLAGDETRDFGCMTDAFEAALIGLWNGDLTRERETRRRQSGVAQSYLPLGEITTSSPRALIQKDEVSLVSTHDYDYPFGP